MTERELFFRYLGMPSISPMALEIVKAEGVFLYDRQGKDYIDLVSGISVSNVGHRHPKILEAIRKQLDQYLYLNVYGEFIQSPQVLLAEKLVSLLPSSLDAVYFVNSGTEAVEGAMKLAKRYTGRREIIAFKDAFHGSTQGALSVLGHESLKQAFRPLLPDIRFLEFNNVSHLKHITSRTACVITETVQSEAGLTLPSDGYLQQLRKQCNETGTLLIFDDVQLGFGRTGFMFSFEPYGVVSDILVLAKAFGAGMPLGAFIASKKVMDTLAYNPELGHITTFGGHPVSCAAAIAGIDVLTSGDLLSLVDKKGQQFEDAVKGNRSVHHIRRKGLSLAVDLADPSLRKTFMESCIKCGLIFDFYLFRPATFRIAPPITITDTEIREAIQRLLKALSA